MADLSSYINIAANGITTLENITPGAIASPAPSISGFSSISSDNIRLMNGNITGGLATVVDDGINSIALALGAQMDVFGFPFSQTTRGQLTISDVTTPSEAIGTWYYQSVSTNAYQIYTDSTYSTLVDATGWSAYTGGGTVAIVKQVPAANILINTNGYLTKFDNTGNLTTPGSIIFGSSSYAYVTYGANNYINLNNDGGIDLSCNTEVKITTNYGDAPNRAYSYFYANGTFAASGNITTTGNITATNIGNVAALNLDGSSSNVLYGNGVFAPATGTSANIANGNSNVSIATANGNVTIAAVGNTTMTITGTGANITGTANISGNVIAGNLMGPLANGNSNVTIATAAGNVVTNVNAQTILTVYTGGIKVGGSGVIQSPGGATAITLNNNGANLPIANITNTLNVTGAAGANITANLTVGNISTGGVVSATGNVSGNFFLGNGSQLTGITVTSLVNGTSNVVVANSGNVTVGVAGSANVITATSTGANVTGTLNATGDVTAQGTGSNIVRRAFGLVAADTYVQLDDLKARVTSSTSQLSLILDSGTWQGTGWTETFAGGGTPSVNNWVNLPLSSGFDNASGAMPSQGNGCRCIISDQTPSAKVYQITVVRSGTTGSQWNISIERLV